MTRPQQRQLVAAAVVLAIIVIGAIVLGRQLYVGTSIRRCVAFFRDAGPWPFFTAMAILPAVGFPLSAFNVVAGSAFGPTLGVAGAIACGSLAIAANLTVCYWLAAGALRPWMEWGVKRLGYTIPEFPAQTVGEIILIVRIIPGPPLCLQNYLLGLVRVPFATYLWISMAVQVIFLTAAVTAGDALMRGDWRALAVAAGLFVPVGVVLHRLRLRLRVAAERKP